jgi:hypothetical protein
MVWIPRIAQSCGIAQPDLQGTSQELRYRVHVELDHETGAVLVHGLGADEMEIQRLRTALQHLDQEAE